MSDAKIAAIAWASTYLAETGMPEGLFVADALILWLRDGGPELNLEQALGLAPGWRARACRYRREALIRDLAGHWPGLRGRAAARAIVARVLAYETQGRWKRDRSSKRPDGLEGIIFELLHLGPMLGEESVRKILLSKDWVI